MEHADIVAAYAKRRPSYEALTAKLTVLLRDLIDLRSIHATVESRTKSVDSFAAKIVRDGKRYADPMNDITDLCGLRVVTRTTLDVEAVLRLLQDEFEIDSAHSVDKAEAFDPTHFGYISQHVIVRLAKPRSLISEWLPFARHAAEIQVRTFAQHAWANISRALEYTREEDIPKPLRRRLHRLSALFELADDELRAIWMEGSALVAEYRRRVQVDATSGVDLNVDSFLAFLQESLAVKDLAVFLESIGIHMEDATLSSRDVAMLQHAGFQTIGDVAQLLRSTNGWAKAFLADYFRTYHAKAITDHALTVNRNGVVLYLLVGAYPKIFTPDVLANDFGWDFGERVLAAATQHRSQ